LLQVSRHLIKKIEIYFLNVDKFKSSKRISMPYNTTGVSHREGVSNEKKITDFLNLTNGSPLKLNELFGSEKLYFKQIGGTKSVSDMDISDGNGKLLGVSIKNHKQGSFDYVNTSKIYQYLPETVINSIKEGVAAIKSEFIGNGERLDEARVAVEILLETAFSEIKSEDIRRLLQHINVRNPKLIMINDVKTHTLKCYHESAFTELSTEPYKDANTYALKTTRAKTSRQITRNGIVTNLRVRIVLNNGVKALIGLSKSNKSSIPVVKVQQDSVDKVLKNTTVYSECDFPSE
jgi:hypothetical protein